MPSEARLLAIALVAGLCCRTVDARACQLRNFAGDSIDFYWMDVNNWGTYIKQNTRPLMNASSMPLKTYETHRFFAAWADESPEVMSWDPDQIPSSLQFTHRGFDQVITAKVDARGTLYLDDWDSMEGEATSLNKLVDGCSSDDEAKFADCLLDKAAGRVGSLAEEVEFVKAHNQRIKERLEKSYCGAGQFASPPVRALQGGGKLKAELMMDTPDLAIYRVRNFLDEKEAAELVSLAPKVNTTRYTDMLPNTGKGAAAGAASRAAAFAREQVKASAAPDVPPDSLRVFTYGEKEVHAPPCDGVCPLLERPVGSYVGTLLAYPQVPSKGSGAWMYEAADGAKLGFVPEARDGVFFHYKTPKGYLSSMLPRLVACGVPAKEAPLNVFSAWVPSVEGAKKQGHIEL